MESTLSKEQRILRVMRKVLSNVVKDVTPRDGVIHPLSEQTIQDIRDCFALISARENELAQEIGLSQARPHFSDEPQSAKVVPLHKISRARPEGGNDEPDDVA